MGKNLHSVYTAGLMILLKENKILLLKRSKKSHYEPNKYTLPSGSKEANETALQSAIRETAEEVGVVIDPQNVQFASVMIRRKPTGEEWVDFFYITQIWAGVPRIMETDKCDEVKWFDLEDLPNDIIPFIKEAVEKIKTNVKYIEFGFTSN